MSKITSTQVDHQNKPQHHHHHPRLPTTQQSPMSKSKSQPEWQNLRDDIDDLRRFSRLSRRLRMRSTGANNNTTNSSSSHHHHSSSSIQNQLQKLERHAVQRRSMPEIQRADLVYLRAPPTTQTMTQAFRSEEQLSSDWKPRTEFERTYFGDIQDSPRPISSMNYYECNDHHLTKMPESNQQTITTTTNQIGSKLDQNSNLINLKSSTKDETDDYYDPAEIPRRIDDYVVPHSPEFRTSRERLHEIFEHNRYLRRKFFSDLPINATTNNTNTNNTTSNSQLTQSSNKTRINQNNDYQKIVAGLGFGSTETLTSQSNHSAGSSTDGRKSRAGNSPDSECFDQNTKIITSPTRTSINSKDKLQSAYSLPLTYFGSDRYGGTWRSTTGRPDTDHMDRYVTTTGDWKNNRIESGNQDTRKSMPDLSVINSSNSIVRSSCSTTDLNSNQSIKEPNDDAKYFASYVHVIDSSSDIDEEPSVISTSSVTRKKQPPPAALNLTDIDRNYHNEQERNILRNYQEEPSTFRNSRKSFTSNDERQIARYREHVLRSSRSLLELSSSSSSNDLSNNVLNNGRRETRLERMIRRRGQSAFNKSCSDISAFDNEADGLLSPKLVGKASKERLCDDFEDDDVDDVDDDGECHRDKTELQDATGSTLNSVYGPIPYKSPRRYVEGEVTIHYRSPVRSEAKEPLSEEELARRSAENMRRVYQEERRRKYLQELHDIDARRHTDNFIPSQKSPIPLNRYDDFIDDLSYRSQSQEPTPEPRLVARALYNFVGQTPRELTFRRGDLIFVRRQVDKNWYEGEHNAMIGLFPFNYVEIIPYDEIRTLPKKSYEGQARAKFNFIAQTNLELSLGKGELVYLTRRVDENWYEGRVGNRKGIFPVSYVEVLCEPGHRPETPIQNKPVASPASHSMLSNGTSSGKLSMGAHHYTPTIPPSINTTQPHYNSLPKGGSKSQMVPPVNETLHIDTHTEPIPYRALYNYRPQNEDELELNEGDTVYVMEKCDDGWYVGSSQRTGYFGTFPGNYVERL